MGVLPAAAVEHLLDDGDAAGQAGGTEHRPRRREPGRDEMTLDLVHGREVRDVGPGAVRP